MLPKREKQLVDLLATRIATILRVEEPFQFEHDDEKYQAEWKYSENDRSTILAIYKTTYRTGHFPVPIVYARVKIEGTLG